MTFDAKHFEAVTRTYISEHQKVNEINDQIYVVGINDPAPGVVYEVDVQGEQFLARLYFHHGPGEVPEGLTNEVLIAVMLDRLRGWQANPETRCRENAIMITNLEETLMWARARAERLEQERAGE
jgi:hypothetical protein